MKHEMGGRARTAGSLRLSLGIVLAENFTLSSFSLFTDLMRLAADEGDLSRPLNVQWSVMSERARATRASCGVAVGSTSAFLDPQQFDYVVVVGGLLHTGPQLDEATGNYLRKAARAGIPLIGMCTGSFALCRIGLMQGRRSCVSWYHYQDFRDEFPDQEVVADRLFLVDGDRITCPGGAGAADLAIHLIERHLGRALAQKAQQILLFDHTRAERDAQPHPPITTAVTNTHVRRALLLMEQNLARPLPIAALAATMNLSSRQLERLFDEVLGQSPAAIYRAVRMRYAAWLLTHSTRSVTDIALSAGYSDCAHFSRQFRETYGFSPSSRPRLRADAHGELAASRIFD